MLNIYSQYGNTKFLYISSPNVDRTDKFEKGQYYQYEVQQYILLKHTYSYLDNFKVTPSYQRFKEKINRHSPTKKEI